MCLVLDAGQKRVAPVGFVVAAAVAPVVVVVADKE
jgi:hypothetical protein